MAVAPQFTDPQPPAYVPPVQVEPVPRPVSATSVDIPAAVFAYENSQDVPQVVNDRPVIAHAVLVIERGDSPGTEFRLINDDSTIGRWDADNGVFPDVDLDAFDSDAKVSRRHARIRRSNGSYYIEDLGSVSYTHLTLPTSDLV